MNNELWTILCPGPSLDLDYIHDPYDFLVAVNGAITAGFADYWAVIDTEVFATCMATAPWILGYNTTLWVPERWYLNLPEHTVLGASFMQIHTETFCSTSVEEFAKVMPFGKSILWRERTMFMAIALAILKGAKQISIYGADLKGSGYFRDGLKNSRTRHNLKRWNEERYWLARIILESRKHGVRIIRRGK